MTLTQDQILSLMFVSTNIEKEITMSEIIKFLEKLENNTNAKQYSFFMPMHDDFNTELFEENKETGNIRIKRFKPVNLLQIYEIVKSTIEQSGDKENILRTLTEVKIEYIEENYQNPKKEKLKKLYLSRKKTKNYI